MPISKQVCQFFRYIRDIYFIPKYSIRRRVKSLGQVKETLKWSAESGLQINKIALAIYYVYEHSRLRGKCRNIQEFSSKIK